MKLGIVGQNGSGKSTVFNALTKNIPTSGYKIEDRIGTISVPDERVDILKDMYKPEKTIYAKVEYFLSGKTLKKNDSGVWNTVRDCDALIHVVRNYDDFSSEKPEPLKHLVEVEEEMILADIGVAEKRIERIGLDKKRGKKINQEELTLLEECLGKLENEEPLRNYPHLAAANVLKGFAFISAKPLLILFNNTDEDEVLPETSGKAGPESCMVIRGKLESEIAQMSDEEMADFMKEFNIKASATDRVIRKSYEILGLISFFTVGKDEVKAWTVRRGTPALEAAGVIHSDIQKGFIRAEVLSYDDLMSAGSFQEAKKKGTVRLESKQYEVKDGDIINFRFNV